MKALVFGLLSYKIVNDSTGELIEGTNLYYISPDVSYNNLSGFVGFNHSKCKISDSIIKKYDLTGKTYPFLCDLEFGINVTPNGKAVAVLSDIKNIKKVDIF